MKGEQRQGLFPLASDLQLIPDLDHTLDLPQRPGGVLSQVSPRDLSPHRGHAVPHRHAQTQWGKCSVLPQQTLGLQA
jgi:hypothetical protein